MKSTPGAHNFWSDRRNYRHWMRLRNLARFIADFFAPSVGLIVEVDGGAHRGSRSADHRRDEKLQRLGYRIARLEAALVLRSP